MISKSAIAPENLLDELQATLAHGTGAPGRDAAPGDRSVSQRRRGLLGRAPGCSTTSSSA